MVWTVTVILFSLMLDAFLQEPGLGSFLLGMEVKSAVRIMTDDQVQ